MVVASGFFGSPHVVVIEESQIFPRGIINPYISCHIHPRLVGINWFQMSVQTLVFFQDSAGGFVRGRSHHNYFNIIIQLFAYTI